MVIAALLLALAQPAEPVPVCALVTPGGQNIGFFIGGDESPDHIRLSATPGAVWPTATLRAARQPASGSSLRFALGAERGLMLELGGLAVGRTQRPATLFRRDGARTGLPVAIGYCEDRPVNATAAPPSADPAAVGADNAAFDPARWPQEDCALLLADGRRLRFSFALAGETRLRLGSGDLWSGRTVTTDMGTLQVRGSVQFSTFGSAGGPEGVQMMFVEQPLAVRLVRFRALGEADMPTMTGYGICGHTSVTRRGNGS